MGKAEGVYFHGTKYQSVRRTSRLIIVTLTLFITYLHIWSIKPLCSRYKNVGIIRRRILITLP